MCFFPPLADACEAAGWQCDGCVRAVASGGVLRSLPAVGETIEVDIAEAEAAGGGGAWVAAEVAEHLGEGRFAARYETWRFCASLGDSASHRLSGHLGSSRVISRQELSMDDEGLDWRRLPPQGAAAAQAAAAAAAAAEEAAAAARASAAERRSADAAALARDTQPRPSPLLAKVEALFREGYVIADGCIDAVQVETCLDVVEEGFKHYMHSVKQLDLQEELLASGFMEIKMRSAGRWASPSTPPALGSDATLTHFGCMLSFPGSATQPWHSDGPHMNAGGDPRFVAPVHAVNVFVPLANGPTEYVPGSHLDFDAKVPSKTPSLKAGSALIFDYRLKHRGLGNSGTEERPLLYITYAKPFWLDVYNFDRKRYKNLPAASRAERTEKRQRTIFGGLP
ncbi:hypothetical protein EMIHUDRAFT_350957 [Emiliania huxleyi CCMP1516]|uniref:Fe2OG dioxygenase domain-containing protein n=2 Tax=Emiliania huxleyi TaxID=2903 RepID=A0A0D3I7U3_EMIH1|nr:hypothetical protein EMIHUDRAFT_350957 [Emiliania huxleyi CCMP1516]EOD07328.1 hypothetical protein EMIHUDRAFT_350957 [Emiliania huxleyi CCMP1516]|eukprot:XP_005759757.1 hypothetical protein EMIHUDRAFT_350957 [Emiliania huxleyi CCMP1516]